MARTKSVLSALPFFCFLFFSSSPRSAARSTACETLFFAIDCRDDRIELQRSRERSRSGQPAPPRRKPLPAENRGDAPADFQKPGSPAETQRPYPSSECFRSAFFSSHANRSRAPHATPNARISPAAFRHPTSFRTVRLFPHSTA